MFKIHEHIPLAPKTTMQIGGNARYYAELKAKEDVEEAVAFAKEKQIPLIPLGAGSNTIFAEGTIDALVVKVAADDMKIESLRVHVHTGCYLASLVNALAGHNLDLSPLTGIPGTVGGAIFGNAGQGFGGVWIGNFIESVEVFIDGAWRTFTNDECQFGYRTSIFKKMPKVPVLWSCTLNVCPHPKTEILAEINRLLKRRIETQPHRKTAGSVFLSPSKETPAWKLIDAAGLRGKQIGGIRISEKHANFFVNEGGAAFEDAKEMILIVQDAIKNQSLSSSPLHLEMRFVENNGACVF